MASTFASTVVDVVTADAHPSAKPALLTGCLPAAIGKSAGWSIPARQNPRHFEWSSHTRGENGDKRGGLDRHDEP